MWMCGNPAHGAVSIPDDIGTGDVCNNKKSCYRLNWDTENTAKNLNGTGDSLITSSTT